MIALDRLRDDPDAVRRGAQLKGEPAPVDEVLALDERARSLRTEAESLRAEQNRLSRSLRGTPGEADRLQLAALKNRQQELTAEMVGAERRRDELLLYLPNPPHESVPHGSDETGNVVVRTWEGRPEFDFTPLPHYEIGERLGIFDFERAARLSGSRFALLLGDGARLQRALATLMLDLATTRHGYGEVSPPYVVRREAMLGTAQLPKFEDDAFHTDGDMFLIPTAEVPVTNLYAGEILDGEQLPIRHVALTPCWRREAGAAGKDTRGYVRLHQFDKVELVKFVAPETSLDELEGLVSDAESVLQELGIHYRVLLMCTGDMGFAQWKKYDIEAWCPGLERYLEVSSCSVFADFQARRAGIRYRPSAGERPRFVHTLNGSALALPRTVCAVLETYQQADGTVVVPAALRPYMGGQELLEAR